MKTHGRGRYPASPTRHGVSALIMGLLMVVASAICAAQSSGRTLLKRPPEDISPGAQWARAAVRERFPELLRTPINGFALASVVLAPDGRVVLAQKRSFAEGIVPDRLDYFDAAAPAGAERDDVLYGGNEDLYAIGPWLDTANASRIGVVYAVLRWAIDPKRSSRIVRRAVRSRFPELFAPPQSRAPFRIVTVFMNNDGSIESARAEVLTPGNGTFITLANDPIKDLGVDPSKVGRRGATDDAGVLINFAWPLREDDNPAELISRSAPRASRDDTDDDPAIIERYFPQAARIALRPGERRWILFGRDGRVWGTGAAFYGNSPLLLLRDIEGRFPGAKVTSPWGSWGSVSPRGMNCLGDTDEMALALSVSCVWIAADSPVSTPARVDFSKRANVFLIAGVTLDAGPQPEFGTALRFDIAAQLPAPYENWQIVAHRDDLDHAQITLRFASGTDRDGPIALTTRITYGERAVLKVGPEGHGIRQITFLGDSVPPAERGAGELDIAAVAR